jgi:hypothetical protein
MGLFLHFCHRRANNYVVSHFVNKILVVSDVFGPYNKNFNNTMFKQTGV